MEEIEAARGPARALAAIATDDACTPAAFDTPLLASGFDIDLPAQFAVRIRRMVKDETMAHEDIRPGEGQGRVVQVFVRTLTGKSVAVTAGIGDSVGDIQMRIQDQEGIPPEYQRLIFVGKQLDADQTLHGSGIQAGSTLHLTLRLRGGMRPARRAPVDTMGDGGAAGVGEAPGRGGPAAATGAGRGAGDAAAQGLADGAGGFFGFAAGWPLPRDARLDEALGPRAVPEVLWRAVADQARADTVVLESWEDVTASMEPGMGPLHLVAAGATAGGEVAELVEASPCSLEPQAMAADADHGEGERPTCGACLDGDRGGEELWVSTHCGHFLHAECAGRMAGLSADPACPQCRAPLAVASEFSRGREPAVEPEDVQHTVLVAGPLGRELSQLLSGLAVSGRNVRVVAMAVVDVGEEGLEDVPQLTAAAIKAWGSRCVQRLQELAVLGGPVQALRSGPRARPRHVRVLAGTLLLPALPLRSTSAPLLGVVTAQGAPLTVRVLAQEGAADQAAAAILEEQRHSEGTGRAIGVSSYVRRAGRHPEALRADGLDVVCATLQLHGRWGPGQVDDLVGRLRGLEDSELGPATAIFVWGPRDWQDAVLVPTPLALCTTAVERLRAVAGRVPCRTWVSHGAVLVGGVAPGQVHPLLELAGLVGPARGIHRPVRLVSSGFGDGGGPVRIKLTAPDEGVEGLCLVRTGGAADAGAVAEAAARVTGGRYEGTPVIALDPADDQFRPMIQLRVDRAQVVHVQRLIAAGPAIVLSHAVVGAIPSTCTRAWPTPGRGA